MIRGHSVPCILRSPFCVLLAACGGPAAVPPPAPAADPCAIAATTPSRDTVRIALSSPVEPAHAPAPATDDERLVFRQLYETLVRVDCAGAVRPGLATRWRSDDDGTRWTFEVSPRARFWDGAPVDAAALREAWLGAPGLPVADVLPSADGAVVVTLREPRALEAFGDAGWSVVKRIPESPWPVGTGPLWTRGWEGTGSGRVLRAAPTPDAPEGTPAVEFRVARAPDPRDVLDQPVDIMVTRDAGVVRYAAGAGDWRVTPLPWDRVYVLASAVRIRSGTTVQLTPDDQAALARDAVRDDARAPGTARSWWATSCQAEAEEPTATGSPGPDRRGLVIAPADDRVAADLVARLVARADAELADLLGERGAAVRAGAADRSEYAARLAAGDAGAYVIPLPASPLDPCRAAATLRALAPWLAPTGAVAAEALAPLVETRAHLLLRDGPMVGLDHDGGVRLVPERRP
jgi:hypothetical protein